MLKSVAYKTGGIKSLSNSKKTPWIVGYNSNNFLFCLQFLFIAFIEENLENF